MMQVIAQQSVHALSTAAPKVPIAALQPHRRFSAKH
jgi:hypothetical protein